MSADLKFFFEAKAAGEFKHMDAAKVHRINAELSAGDLVILICGDCKHSRDQIGHIFRTFESMDPHLLAFNGGPLKADGLCNVRNAGLAQDEILEALEAKPHIGQVLLINHYPCAIAAKARMTVRDQIVSQLTVKRHLRERIGFRTPAVKIGLLYHVFYEGQSPEEARRMYYFCNDGMQTYLDATPDHRLKVGVA